MIIDKKFSIITYAGSLPLNLMTKDATIASDAQKSNDWDKMMQSVDSIYGTQKFDNTIPVFWTKRFSVTDQFGNVSYKYAPNPESTLRTLDSKSSYYIILRDSSMIPLKIPSNGGLVLGYTDTDDLPYVFPALSDITLRKESFEYLFKPRIVNLRPFETYTYSWKAIAGNWPVAVNALSGTLKPASPTGTINTSMTFCPSTGLCSDKILSYNVPSDCSLEQIKDPFITLQLSVVANATGAESLSDQFTLYCDDCLPKPRISISGISSSSVVENNNQDVTPSYSFSLIFNNLDIDKSYSYSVETLKADWPIVYVTPISGLFINKSTNTMPIDGKFYFCPTTGLCQPNGNNIPNYSVPNYPKFLTDDAEYNVYLRASLSGVGQSACTNTNSIYSDIVRITYKNY